MFPQQSGFQSNQLGNTLRQCDHMLHHGNPLPITWSTVPSSHFTKAVDLTWRMDVDMRCRQPAIVDGFGISPCFWRVFHKLLVRRSILVKQLVKHNTWLILSASTVGYASQTVVLTLRLQAALPSGDVHQLSNAEGLLHNPMPWFRISGLFLLVRCGYSLVSPWLDVVH